MSADDNAQRIRAYFELLYGKELETLLAMFADDIEWLIVPTATRIHGKSELRALAANHWRASPDRIKTMIGLFASDDFACLEYTSSGTVTAEADFVNTKVAPTGRRYELQCCFVFHFRRDGKIDRVREDFDMGTVVRQLGGGPSG